MGENLPNWKISELYSKAWTIVKKSKVVWLFGLAAAILNLAGFDSGNIFSSTRDAVVNESQSSETSETLNSLLSSVPTSIYVAIGIEVILFLILMVVIAIITSAWAEGSLLNTTKEASEGKSPSIASASMATFPHLKPLIWLSIVPKLVLGLSALGIFAALFTGLGATSGLPKILLAVLTGMAVFITIYASLLLGMSLIWAVRSAVFDNKGAVAALKEGYVLAKRKFWRMLGLGTLNNIISGIVLFLPLIPSVIIFVLALVFWPNLKDESQAAATITLISGAAILIAIYIFLFGAITAFKAAVWTLAYEKIKEKHGK